MPPISDAMKNEIKSEGGGSRGDAIILILLSNLYLIFVLSMFLVEIMVFLIVLLVP